MRGVGAAALALLLAGAASEFFRDSDTTDDSGARPAESGATVTAPAPPRAAPATQPPRDNRPAEEDVQAEARDTVSQHLEQALELEQQGRFDEARAEAPRTSEINPSSSRARAVLQRIDSALSANEGAMPEVTTTRDRRELGNTGGTFEQGTTANTSSDAEGDEAAGAQTAAAESSVVSRLRRARVLEQQEQWQAAAREYSTVLSMEPANADARRGLSGSSKRAAFSTRVDRYLQAPERLSSESARAAARGLLREAKTIASRGSTLSSQLSELRELLALSNRPVPVRIESNNLTEVTIDRVGELGRFAAREVELRPGSYTVVGSRDGYREVRTTLRITAGEPRAQILVRSVEPVQ